MAAGLFVSEWQGTEADYDRTLERVQREVEPDARCVCHAMAVTGNNQFSVVEVWSDRAAMEAWFERARPVIEEGADHHQLSWNMYDVHSLLTGDAAAQESHDRMQDA
jgi:heme-degrading monooxygenase HmoA